MTVVLVLAVGGTYAAQTRINHPKPANANSTAGPSWTTPPGLPSVAPLPQGTSPTDTGATTAAPTTQAPSGATPSSPNVPPAGDASVPARAAQRAVAPGEHAITAAAGPTAAPTTKRPVTWIKTSGTRLSQVHVQGNLYLSGNRITVENVVVDGDIVVNGSPQGGIISPVPADLVLRHVQARGIFSNGFNGLTLDAVELTNQANAPHAQLFNYADPSHNAVFPAKGLVIQNSWFHGVRPSTTTAHMENLHIGGVQGAVIRNNVFELRSPDGSNTQQYFTANLAMEPNMYGVFNSNFVIEGNWFRGGGAYQLYMNATGTSRVSGNHFFSDSPTFAGVQYPPDAYIQSALPSSGYVRFAQSGNTLDGKPLPLPGGR